MIPGWIHMLNLQVAIYLLGLSFNYANADAYYGYADDGADGGDYYGYEEQVDKKKQGEDYPDVEPFNCYACHYEVNGQSVTGTANCDDPFNEFGIETIPCYSYCAKFRKQLNDKNQNDYLLTRICLPKCKNVVDGLEYTDCCKTDKCNGAVPSRSVTYGFTLVTVICSIALTVITQS